MNEDAVVEKNMFVVSLQAHCDWYEWTFEC